MHPVVETLRYKMPITIVCCKLTKPVNSSYFLGVVRRPTAKVRTHWVYLAAFKTFSKPVAKSRMLNHVSDNLQPT